MEQSQLISTIIAKLKIAYMAQFSKFSEADLLLLVKTYQEALAGYDGDIVLKAIDDLIKTNKYIPTIAEIIESCEKQGGKNVLEVLKRMYDDGYFNYSEFGTLDGEQALMNLSKADRWVRDGIIPDWLMEDMKKYGYITTMSLPNIDVPMLEERGRI